MDPSVFIPPEFRTEVEQWLGDAITSLADIDRIVEGTGIRLGEVEMAGTPAQRWNRAVGRILLENRFHLLLNGLAKWAPNSEYSAKIQGFSKAYDEFVANGMVVDNDDLRRRLDELITADEPQALAALSRKIRDCVRAIRADIDNDRLWLALPFTTSGYAAQDVRDELSATCLRVVAAADGLIHETRILTHIIDDSMIDDPEISVRRQRQQLRAMTQAKVALAQKGGTLLKTIRARTLLETEPPDE